MENCGVQCCNLESYNVHPEVIHTVLTLTHFKDEEYSDYINRVKENSTAHNIKIADIRANLSDNPTRKQAIKYAKALLLLLCGINDFDY